MLKKTKIRFEKNDNTIINRWKPCSKIGKIMGEYCTEKICIAPAQG